MIHKAKQILLAMLSFLVPALAMAQDQPATVPTVDPEAMSAQLAAALQSHSWALAVAAGVMLAVWLVGKLGLFKSLPTAAVPWVSIGLGMVAASATALIAGKPTMSVITAGIEAGLAAVGAWEAAGKHLLTFGKKEST